MGINPEGRNGMISKQINSHLDQVDKLKEQIRNDIDELIKDINLEDAISSPEDFFDSLAIEIGVLIIDKYGQEAISLGEDFSTMLDGLKKDLKIEVAEEADQNAS